MLIPVQCEYYALEGLSELISTLKTIRKKYNPYLDIEGVVFTMFSLRYNLTVQVVEQVQKYFGSKVYKTTIPRSIRISEAPSYGQPINFYEPKARAAKPTWTWQSNLSSTTARRNLKSPAQRLHPPQSRRKMLWKIKTGGTR